MDHTDDGSSIPTVKTESDPEPDQMPQVEQAKIVPGGDKEAALGEGVDNQESRLLEEGEGLMFTPNFLQASQAFANAVAVEVENQMSDLLVCLGQEEQKVTILSEALRSCGQDPQALLKQHGCDDESMDAALALEDAVASGEAPLVTANESSPAQVEPTVCSPESSGGDKLEKDVEPGEEVSQADVETVCAELSPQSNSEDSCSGDSATNEHPLSNEILAPVGFRPPPGIPLTAPKPPTPAPFGQSSQQPPGKRENVFLSPFYATPPESPYGKEGQESACEPAELVHSAEAAVAVPSSEAHEDVLTPRTEVSETEMTTGSQPEKLSRSARRRRNRALYVTGKAEVKGKAAVLPTAAAPHPQPTATSSYLALHLKGKGPNASGARGEEGTEEGAHQNLACTTQSGRSVAFLLLNAEKAAPG
eukprot:gene6722-8044_t